MLMQLNEYVCMPLQTIARVINFLCTSRGEEYLTGNESRQAAPVTLKP